MPPDRKPEGALPGPLEPMKAVAVTSLPPDDGRWAYEVKWDGVRALVYVEGPTVRVQSRSLRDVTIQYPELQVLAGTGGPWLLDGEIVAYDPSGRPSFELLQQRINLRPAGVGAGRMASVPVSYVVFDLLHASGRSLMDLPYTERRAALEALSAGTDRLGGPVAQGVVGCPAYHVGDGAALLEATRLQGLEGLVAKRLDSPYLPGRRSRCWLKIKNFRRQELVVGGWLPGEGGRLASLGALLVGYHEAGGLRYAGRVGSGLSTSDLTRMSGLLAGLARSDSPFLPPPTVPATVRRLARWVEPRLVAEVAFSEWTAGGTLRQPSFKGLRADRDPASVVREPG